ncbi:hypothetical protein F7725_022152 [Dissostichus mawsoni]|uniref:cAMP-responsive element-binding protein-like 2 n=1 Tax=Dissostichus mawsoni TaxID=36200 RepID=A0A7J5ZDT6_DISMA|nr:hypothetical protein F7725_022152 [Dissostichus mawsoni]
MSLNFSERENATTLPTTPLCSLEGNATAADELTPASRRTQSTTNYFVVSMACADLLMSLGWAPFILLQVYVLLSISVDRSTILYPLSFKVSREKAKKMIAASWLFDAAFVSPFLLLRIHRQPTIWADCPTPPFTFCSVSLFRGAHRVFLPTSVRYIWRISADGHTVRRTMNIVPRTKVKTIKMFLMLNSVSSPGRLSTSPSCGTRGNRTVVRVCSSHRHRLDLLQLHGLQPTLYSVYNANFRRGMRETFCMSSMKCYRSNAYTITASSRSPKRTTSGRGDPRPEQDGRQGLGLRCMVTGKVKKPGKRGRKPAKIDLKAKLERSRQSARECRARKKLRYQYLEELVSSKERAICALRGAGDGG